MAGTQEQFLTWLNNSDLSGDLPINLSPTGNERVFIHNPSTNRAETMPQTPESSIKIGGTTFKLIKGYTGSVKNILAVLEPNDFISDAVIRVSDTNIYINKSKYLSGVTSDFGSYSSVNHEFTGGNYKHIRYSEI